MCALVSTERSVVKHLPVTVLIRTWHSETPAEQPYTLIVENTVAQMCAREEGKFLSLSFAHHGKMACIFISI